MRWVLPLVAAAACTHAPAGAPAPASALPPDATRHYAITFGGARVGTATETEAWTAAGLHFVRAEEMRFLRGDDALAIATTIDIVADRALVPSRVAWVERTGSAERRGSATRDPARGWTVTVDDVTSTIPDAAAIPAELAPLRVRRDGRFAGGVFLPARGFAAGTGAIDPIDATRFIARLGLGTTSAGAGEATIDVAADRMPARVVDGEGVIATRTTAADAAADYPLVDLIAAGSVPILGRRPADAPAALGLDGDLAIPPLPGQRERADGRLELSPRLPGALPPGPRGTDRTADIALLVRAVRDRIAPDLAAAPTSNRDAVAATAGDCTTFALAYAALAAERAIPTRVVTGLRIAGDHLVRHRWAVSWTGRAWIAVDAAYGEAPAGGELVGLAVHGSDDAGLVAGEAALTHVHAARW